MIEIRFRRENHMWIADVQEGRYQIEGPSNRYKVWYYPNDKAVAPTLVAEEQYYIDYAKQSAENDYATRTSVEALASEGFALLVKAQNKIALARDATRRIGAEEAERTLMSVHDVLYALRTQTLEAKKEAQAAREAAAS